MFLSNNYFSNHIRINFAQEVGNDVKNKKIDDKEQIKNDNKDTIKQFKVSNDPKAKLNPINMSSFIIIFKRSQLTTKKRKDKSHF